MVYTAAITSFPTRNGLATLLAASMILIFAAVFAMYILLTQIELHSKLTFASEATDDVALEEHNDEDLDDKAASGAAVVAVNARKNAEFESKDNEITVVRRFHLSWCRRGVLAFVVVLVTFMTYLLLVVSNANVVLSWMGMFLVWTMIMRQSIIEELNRNRFDRLAAILSLIMVLAMGLNLAAYANRQHAQGDIYEGKARIVGYDIGNYTQDATKDVVLRTDLMVAWGGSWGCPNTPDQACEGFVSGALCEAKVEEPTTSDGGDRRQRRKLPFSGRGKNTRQRALSTRKTQEWDADDLVVLEQAEIIEEQVQTANEALAENQSANDEQQNSTDSFSGNQTADVEEQNLTSQDAYSKNEELEKQNQELQQEHDELEKENEELQQELEQYINATDAEEEEMESFYTFDDDQYVDSYWEETAWDSIWGGYSCEDLFDYDVDGESFDNEKPPGTDEWPFINIYGNCNTCEAYIVDYYSTEHFSSILSFKTAAINYGILAGIGLIVTAFLFYKEMAQQVATKPNTDKEVELLPYIVNMGALA